MRNPISSETDAFHLALGGAALTGASLAVGALDPLAGAALFGGGVIGAVIWELSRKDPHARRPLLEAAIQGRRKPDAPRGVLVVANRTLQGEDLEGTLRRRGAKGAELRVVAPILVSRARYIASDVDKELNEARERLAAMLAWAESEGLEASGNVGDPNVAFGSIEDELRVFAADEVVISTYPPGKSNWLETGVVERLRDELDIPVTHVVVDPEREELAVADEPATGGGRQGATGGAVGGRPGAVGENRDKSAPGRATGRHGSGLGSSRGALMDVDPVEVQRHLSGVSYPAKKDELIAAADDSGAPQEVIEALQALAGEEFGGPDEVQAALG